MTKSGNEYQDIVAAVQRELDPGAAVRVGVWITGRTPSRHVRLATLEP
jgi:hypothetical protein